MERVFLLPGEYHISEQPVVIETLVGSCVTVCLCNVKTGHAAMNHFLMHDSPPSPAEDFGRYAVTATQHIIQALMSRDPVPEHYRAQVFGGASVLKSASELVSIGQANTADAKRILASHRIRIIREETGGTRGRRVKFDTSTNTVFCRFAGQVGKKRHGADSGTEHTR
jgi:chemotaxis protein CheD